MVEIPCNVGGTERTTRIGIGTALLGVSFAAPIPKSAKIAAGILGVMGVVTGLAHYCPVSQALHRNTCPTAHHPHD
ncbi:MAG: YgaP family membrane protein [Armatimonadota bacterium]